MGVAIARAARQEPKAWQCAKVSVRLTRSEQQMVEKAKKNKQYVPTSITVTPEDLAYIKKFPNFSELIRRILAKMREQGTDVEPKLEIIALGIQLDEFNREMEELRRKRVEFCDSNVKFWQYDTKEYVTNELIDNPDTITDWAHARTREVIHAEHILKKDANGNPVPMDSEDAKLAFKRLKDMDAAMVTLGAKVDELKKRIMAA